MNGALGECVAPMIERSPRGGMGLELSLVVTDSELCAMLERHAEGRARHDFAVEAMRIGALALRQAQGQIDADRVRREGEHLLGQLGHVLNGHQKVMTQQITSSLKEYFDPETGRFNERVERLIRQDGELESVLRRQIGIDGSELTRTLAVHLGDESELMKLLDPEGSNGLLNALSGALGETLREQRERILGEFSLDNKNGALTRLMDELTEHHGEVSQALEKRIDAVVAEFSLDREDSGLSRLVRRVERAQSQISSEFSLDEKDSALARMRREILDVIDGQRQANERFQQDVLGRLAEMVVRKQEVCRSTRHGDDFEVAVFGLIQDRSQMAGDVATRVNSTTGMIKHCKKGDVIVDLGPDHAAAGARIVVEAKEDASCTLQQALVELEEARKNRGAQVGLFVFSARTAPERLEPLTRYGDDIVIVWDAEDPRTDVALIAGVSVAKALCARAKAHRNAEAADFQAIERAILEIEKQARGLDEITRSAETIKSGSEKVLNRARIMREALADQVSILGSKVAELRSLTAPSRAAD